MLTPVAEGVWVAESECLQSNTVIVRGDEGVLVIDPGLTVDELTALAADLEPIGPVVAGFATHAHWDHVLWHPLLGDAPRFTTARSAETMRALLAQPDWVSQVAEGLPDEVAGEVPMHLLGLVDALPHGAREVPWSGPTVRILEHDAHEAGHAALLVGDVLIAGDMLSDRLVPMLGLHGPAADPLGDYLAGLDVLAGVPAGVVIPGHGSVGTDLAQRIADDRAYVLAMRDGTPADDPRIDARAAEGWDWVVYLHEAQVEALASL